MLSVNAIHSDILFHLNCVSYGWLTIVVFSRWLTLQVVFFSVCTYICLNLNNFTKSFIDFLLTALGQTTVAFMSMGCKQQFHKI